MTSEGFPQIGSQSGSVGGGAHLREIFRKDPDVSGGVRAIVAHWRELTSPGGQRRRRGGARTLIGLSGGADSSALALALRSATDDLVLAHIRHDLRTEQETLVDLQHARQLGHELGLTCVDASVQVREPHGENLEARARMLRYRELERLAREQGCAWVAVGQHADDQLETVFMQMLRGSGARGMGFATGMVDRRRISPGSEIRLIRPMLTTERLIDRAMARRICQAVGMNWCEDASNTDTTRLRAAIRVRVAPLLKELGPAAALKSVAMAQQAQGAARVIKQAATQVLKRVRPHDELPGRIIWIRDDLRNVEPIVLGHVLVLAMDRVREARGGGDGLRKRQLDRAIRAIKDISTDPRVMRFGEVEVQVRAGEVEVSVLPSRP